MAFCITFGTQEFTSQLKGAENITCQCRNCGNWSGRVITRWPWFTLCFIPVLPLAMHKYTEVSCHICRFHQDLKDRPDVQGMIQSGGQGNQVPHQQYQGGQPGQQGGPPGGPKPQYA